MLTKGAIGNLINRYKAVLKKCHIMNTFGSLAVAAMLVGGSISAASAAEYSETISGANDSYDLSGIRTGSDGSYAYVFQPGDTLVTDKSYGVNFVTSNSPSSITVSNLDIKVNGIDWDSTHTGVSFYSSSIEQPAQKNFSMSGGSIAVTNTANAPCAYGMDVWGEGHTVTFSDVESISAVASATSRGATAAAINLSWLKDSAVSLGNTDLTAEATGKWGQAYGIVADGEGSSSVKMGDGNIKAQATTTGETEGAYASGILVDPGYTVSKNDGSINVTATALNGGKEAYASGVNNIGGTVTLGDTDFIVTATADNANAWASGLDNRSGPLSMGNGTMIVTASGEDKINAAYGIRAWSDSKEVSTGLVNITAKTVGGNTTDDYVEAISVLAQSGKISMEGGSLTALSDKGIAYGLHATNTDSITFGSAESTASIYARSQADSAMGIYLNDSSLQKGVGDIVVESAASRADGVFITDSSKANLGSGLISVSGAKASTAISALGESDVILNGGMLNATSSAGNAYGIWVDNSTISSAENSSPLDIKVASLDSGNVSEAIGVLALSGADVNLGNGNIDAKADNSVQAIGIFADGSHVTKGSGTISAHSEGGKVFGVYAEAAEMTLGAAGETLTIAASGNDNAVGIAVRDNTTLTLAGHTDIVAPVALEGWNGSVINRGNLTTEGTVSGFTGSYVQTSGSTWLGEQSGFFSGDVEIQGGTLVAGLDTLGNLQPDGNQALLALGSSVNLTSGNRLLVGSVDDTNTAAVAFGANSMLVVDGKSDSNGAFISASDGDVAVDEKSTLYIVNAQAGAEYTITDGLNVNDGQSWSHENLLGNRLADMVVDSTDDSIVVSVSAKEAALAIPDVVSPAALNSMMMGKQNDIDSSSLGIRFLSRATDQRIFSSDALAVATINEVSRAAVTAGVQNTALRLAEAGTDQLIHHLSLSFFDKGNSIHKDGLDVWATPMYGNTYSHGLDASGTSVRGNYGGLSLGADMQAGEILGGRYVWARPCTVEEVSPKRKVRPRIRKIPTASAE